MTIIWQNGRLLPQNQATLPLNDRGYLLGDGVFDTLLAIDGAPQHADRHIRRLLCHAEIINLQHGLTEETIKKAHADLLQQNCLKSGRASIRLTLSRLATRRGLSYDAKAAVHAFMSCAAVTDDKTDKPLRLIISKRTRRNEHSPLSQIKSLNYGDNIIAAAEAREAGVDDALMLNTSGHVSCGTIGNVFVRYRGEWITPPLSEGCMDGIMRGILLEKRTAKEKPVTLAMLQESSAAFMTNSLRGFVPIAKCDSISYEITDVPTDFAAAKDH